jgi:hypothetical protein
MTKLELNDDVTVKESYALGARKSGRCPLNGLSALTGSGLLHRKNVA